MVRQLVRHVRRPQARVRRNRLPPRNYPQGHLGVSEQARRLDFDRAGRAVCVVGPQVNFRGVARSYVFLGESFLLDGEDGVP